MSKQQFKEEHTISLQGKAYLPVAPRVVLFRQEHPRWRILTNIVQVGEDWYVKAEIFVDEPDHQDSVIDPVATAHKRIRAKGEAKGPAGIWPLETAETGAIGRALALCGYGTLSGDLDEGDDLADAPVEAEETPTPKAKRAAKKVADTAASELEQLVAQVKRCKDADSLRLLRKPLRDECMKRPAEDQERGAALELFLKKAEDLGLDLNKPE